MPRPRRGQTERTVYNPEDRSTSILSPLVDEQGNTFRWDPFPIPAPVTAEVPHHETFAQIVDNARRRMSSPLVDDFEPWGEDEEEEPRASSTHSVERMRQVLRRASRIMRDWRGGEDERPQPTDLRDILTVLLHFAKDRNMDWDGAVRLAVAKQKQEEEGNWG